MSLSQLTFSSAGVKPVKMMQALRANIEALQSHAATILRNEKTARVQSKDGALQPVVDEGGREHMQALILDLQTTARTFDDKAKASIERAVAETKCRLSVCSSALAIPTQGPLDSFGSGRIQLATSSGGSATELRVSIVSAPCSMSRWLAALSTSRSTRKYEYMCSKLQFSILNMCNSKSLLPIMIICIHHTC